MLGMCLSSDLVEAPPPVSLSPGKEEPVLSPGSEARAWAGEQRQWGAPSGCQGLPAPQPAWRMLGAKSLGGTGPSLMASKLGGGHGFPGN